MSNQTTIQDSEAVRQGSVRVLIGPDFNNLVDVGALREPSFTFMIENQEIPFDNTREMRKFVQGKKVQATFDLCEINLENLQTLDSGHINYTTVAGTLVSGATQQVVDGDWSYNDFIKIENQNHDGSAITVNSVTGATDGALTEGTDFYVGTNEHGDYGIFVIDSTAVTTESQNLTIDYDYTPAESKKLTFNEDGTKSENVMRIVNTDNNGDEFRLDIEKGTNFTPMSIDFAADDEDDVAVLPIDFQGEVAELVDEQQV